MFFCFQAGGKFIFSALIGNLCLSQRIALPMKIVSRNPSAPEDKIDKLLPVDSSGKRGPQRLDAEWFSGAVEEKIMRNRHVLGTHDDVRPPFQQILQRRRHAAVVRDHIDVTAEERHNAHNRIRNDPEFDCVIGFSHDIRRKSTRGRTGQSGFP